VLKLTSFICGDLAFLCMCVGKEGYEKDWCYICDLFWRKWQQVGHALGNAWTVQSLMDKVKSNKDTDAKGTAMGGVKEMPWFKSIEIMNVIWSVLHGMMGIGNYGVEYLVDFSDRFVENIPDEEVGLKNHLLFLDQKLLKARIFRDTWKESDEGREMKGLPGKIRTRCKNLELGKYNPLQLLRRRRQVFEKGLFHLPIMY